MYNLYDSNNFGYSGSPQLVRGRVHRSVSAPFLGQFDTHRLNYRFGGTDPRLEQRLGSLTVCYYTPDVIFYHYKRAKKLASFFIDRFITFTLLDIILDELKSSLLRSIVDLYKQIVFSNWSLLDLFT